MFPGAAGIILLRRRGDRNPQLGITSAWHCHPCRYSSRKLSVSIYYAAMTSFYAIHITIRLNLSLRARLPSPISIVRDKKKGIGLEAQHGGNRHGVSTQFHTRPVVEDGYPALRREPRAIAAACGV